MTPIGASSLGPAWRLRVAAFALAVRLGVCRVRCVRCVAARCCVLALGLVRPHAECAGGGGLLPPVFPPGGVAVAVWCAFLPAWLLSPFGVILLD